MSAVQRESNLEAAGDYQGKVARETSRLARRMREAGHHEPLGDPTSGVALVVEQPVGPRLVEAIRLSLDSVGLSEAYVTWAGTGLLAQEILTSEPSALVAIGAGAAREIDNLEHRLARRTFSDAAEGVWFSWTRGTAGLFLPPLAPALEDEAAKRRFWRAFLALRELVPSSHL